MNIQISLMFFYLATNYCNANSKSLFDKTAPKSRIIEYGTDIANEYFNFRQLTVMISEDVDKGNVDMFLKGYKGTVVVETKKDGPPPSHVVVLVSSSKMFLRILAKLKPDLKGRTFLNSKAKFLILLLRNPGKIERITKVLWRYHIVNVNLLMMKTDNVSMYTYFPYQNPLNCQNTQPILLNIYKNNKLNKNLYPDKMANMKGCPLYISTNKLHHRVQERKHPLEVTKKAMVKLFRDAINFTPIITAKDYISIDSDRAKNWSDSLSDVILGLANVSTCSIPLGIDRLGLLDYSVPYFRVRLVWLSPPVTTGSVWWRLLSPLNGYLWLNLLLILLIVTILPFTLKMKAVKRFCYKYFKNIDKVHGIAIRVWGVMLGQPIPVTPKRFRDFYIIGLWIWFTFVVRSAYQSVLIGALKTDSIIGDFPNLKEAIDAGYRFGGRAGVLAHFEHDPLIKEKFDVITEEKYGDIYQDVIEGRRKFVIASSLEYSWAYCSVRGKIENECGHILPDTIMSVPLVIHMKAYSPFFRPISVWLSRFIETGLLERNSVKPFSFPMSSEPSPLTSHQTLSCILCLAIGYAISVGVLILEILRYRTKSLPSRFRVKKKRVTFAL